MAGSVFDGGSPLAGDLPLLLVQITLIILISRGLSIILRYLNQPRVLAEVLGGIILGPTVFGRIPGFQATMFPESSMPILKALADVGLVMFLFIVGLELELALLKTTAKAAVIISAVGIAIPFGAAYVAALALEKVLGDGIEVSFGTFGAFIAVANSITAFPVLARIVAEKKLMATPVGTTAITAAALGDLVAWCFLAVVIAISNSKGGNPVNVVWVFLTTFAFAFIMLVIVRPLLNKGIRSSRFEKNHVTQTTVVIAFVLVFISAWITEIIGVHAIFGAFLAGLAMPRHAGFAFALIEKIEDLITIVLLPLYFTYSGLRTQIGSLNTGVAWGMVFLIIAVACTKILGAGLAAKALGHTTRESLAIGVLMNTRGLVELIVLNVGLDSRALNQEIFVVMVIMALVTTFMTTPLLTCIYTTTYIERRRNKVAARKSAKFKTIEDFNSKYNNPPHLTIWLEKSYDTHQVIDLLGIFGRHSILPPPSSSDDIIEQRIVIRPEESADTDPTTSTTSTTPRFSLVDESTPTSRISNYVTISILRLLQVSDRDSSVLRATWMNEETPRDLYLFRSQCRSYGFEPTISMAVTTSGSLVSDISNAAHLQSAAYVVIPWLEPRRGTSFISLCPRRHEVAVDLLRSEELCLGVTLYVNAHDHDRVYSGSADELHVPHTPGNALSPTTYLKNIFKYSPKEETLVESTSPVKDVLSTVNLGTSERLICQSSKRVIVPFFGGRDNRAAALLALQFARETSNTLIHIVRIICNYELAPSDNQVNSGEASGTNAGINVKKYNDDNYGCPPDNDDDDNNNNKLSDDQVFMQFVNQLMGKESCYISLSIIETSLSLDITMDHLVKDIYSHTQRMDVKQKARSYMSFTPLIAGLTIKDIGGPDPWPIRPSLLVVPYRVNPGLLPICNLASTSLDVDIVLQEASTRSAPFHESSNDRKTIANMALGPVGSSVYLSKNHIAMLVVRAPPSTTLEFC